MKLQLNDGGRSRGEGWTKEERKNAPSNLRNPGSASRGDAATSQAREVRSRLEGVGWRCNCNPDKYLHRCSDKDWNSGGRFSGEGVEGTPARINSRQSRSGPAGWLAGREFCAGPGLAMTDPQVGHETCRNARHPHTKTQEAIR